MTRNRNREDIDEVKAYFDSVIDWASSLFEDLEEEMCGLEWGRLYESYGRKKFNRKELNRQVRQLYGDGSVKSRKGIWEFVLGDCKEMKLLNLRVFDDAVAKSQYAKQTKMAKEKKLSNCPLCVQSDGPNQSRIYKFEEMDADHIAAWSIGGATQPENCQMLCKTHNRVKGNR